MSTKKYFCEEWELSSVCTTETQRRVNEFIKEFRKFEDFLDFLALDVREIDLFAGDYGVHIQINFQGKSASYFFRELEVIASYLRVHLPMKSYNDVMKPWHSEDVENYYLEYELDVGGYEFDYPSHDYLYTSLNG